MQTIEYLISITAADVSREGQRVLHNIFWQLRPNENWAFVGANGSGKSTFLKLIRGDLWPEQKNAANRIYCFEDECQETPLGIRKLIGLVDPELHDRYVRNSIDMPGEEVVLTGFFDTVWLQERPSPSMVGAARHLMMLLDLDRLRTRSILTMSRGEALKILIARSLVSGPRVLLMDEVFNGLDVRARKQLFGLLERAIKRTSQLVMATHRISDLGPFITHAMVLKEGRIFRQGRKEEVLRPDGFGKILDPPMTEEGGRSDTLPRKGERTKPSGNKRSLITMRDVNVYINEKSVLKGIDWKMKADENWAVIGKNGAGKSTFLRLISGDRRPASGGRIGRFGRGGSGSIWDIRRKIGYISPELQAEYDENMTAREVVFSGFFSSIGLYRRVTARQERLSGEMLRLLGIEELGPKRVDRISYGEFRKVLIARALINDPVLLLLDEPFSGLDHLSKKDFAQFLDKISRHSMRVILVTHHIDEIIPSISHILVLNHGQIASQGRKEDVLREDVPSAFYLQ